MNGKDELIKLIKTNPIAVWAVISGIVAFIVYAIVFTPLMKQMNVKYAECKRAENEIVSTRNIIDGAKALGKSYGSRVLISEKEAASGIEEFTKHAKGLGVNFIYIKPQNTILKKDTPYKILPIEMELEANDSQFVAFMGSIDELKKTIIAVHDFDIKPDAADRTKLRAKITINLYLSARDGV